jgi:hypothetical protein
MSKITRVLQKLFGDSGPSSDFGVFGSKAAGNPTYSKDPATIQAETEFSEGLGGAVFGTDEVTEIEDLNALFLLLFRQLAYIFQSGIPEYEGGTTYYIGSFCQVAGVIYKSLIDDNTGNAPASNPAKWTNPLADFVGLVGNETVAGVKTFSSFPVTPSSAPTTNYQVANKKYVDDKVAAVPAQVGLGAWSARSGGTQYTEATDGFVVGSWVFNSNTGGDNQSATMQSPTGTVRIQFGTTLESNNVIHFPFCCPVKKGNTWKFVNSGGSLSYCYFIPLGS